MSRSHATGGLAQQWALLRRAMRLRRTQAAALTDRARSARPRGPGPRTIRDAHAREILYAAGTRDRPTLAAGLAAAMVSPGLVARLVAGRALRMGANALPPLLGNAVARRHPRLRALSLGAVRWGDLGRTEPVSREFGFDRGLPVDRYYIESFLESAGEDIRGRVLEIGDATYSRRFGGERVRQQDVLHVHAGNADATIVGDISQPGTLPPSAFDCIVLTQTLHLIYDMRAAVEHLHGALKPGGVLLVTVPGISQLDRGEWGAQWFWSLTPAAVRRLLGEVFGEEAVTVESHGNVFAATAFLHGMALSEVDTRKLDVNDDAYPVIVTAHARRFRAQGP